MARAKKRTTSHDNLADKVRQIVDNPVVQDWGTKMSEGLKFVGEHAVRLTKSAQKFTVETGMRLKAAHLNA